MTYTDSSLADILSDSFSMYKTDEFNSPGGYYYNEIKSYNFQNRPVIVIKSTLDVLDDKLGQRTKLEIKDIISRGLKSFAQRNMGASDADMFTKHLRWKIVN